MNSDNKLVALKTEPRDLLIAFVVSVVVVTIGGYLSGLALNLFGSVGAVSLWLLGWITGMLVRKLVQPSKLVGGLLVVALMLAFVLAEVCWIRWNIVGAESWSAAAAKFPTFLKEYRVDALIAAVFAVFGCMSAYRRTTMP